MRAGVAPRRRGRVAGGRVAAPLLLGLLVAAGAARGAEERAVEGVGAVAVKAGSKPRPGAPREAALRAAIGEAVRQVAFELVPHLDPAAIGPAVERALGSDPRAYANRFRIVEDRGEGPARIVDEPGVETEYVMVVQAQVDVARVRQSLERAGLLAPASGANSPRQRFRVVIEDLDGYAGYMAVRTLLDELGVHGAVPVEMERGRAVLEVESRVAPEDLLDSLVRSAPPELRVEPVASDDTSITLRAHFVPPLGGHP
jgi:hypothetical protein